jgi:hypothetical protein
VTSSREISFELLGEKDKVKGGTCKNANYLQLQRAFIFS